MTQKILRSTFTINLTRGKQAFVDERDWYSLRAFKWHARPNSSQPDFFYAVRAMRVAEVAALGLEAGRQYSVHMHRQIMGLGLGRVPEVDHLNHNTLDNRRANLRIVDHRENMANSRNQSKHGVGVAFDRTHSRFFAHAWMDGRMKYLGGFATAEDAASARRRFLSGEDISDVRYKRQFSEEQIREIRRQSEEGLTRSEIARRLGVSRSIIRHIIQRRIYKDIQ